MLLCLGALSWKYYIPIQSGKWKLLLHKFGYRMDILTVFYKSTFVGGRWGPSSCFLTIKSKTLLSEKIPWINSSSTGIKKLLAIIFKCLIPIILAFHLTIFYLYITLLYLRVYQDAHYITQPLWIGCFLTNGPTKKPEVSTL